MEIKTKLFYVNKRAPRTSKREEYLPTTSTCVLEDTFAKSTMQRNNNTCK
jgi:hypothetical protein